MLWLSTMLFIVLEDIPERYSNNEFLEAVYIAYQQQLVTRY